MNRAQKIEQVMAEYANEKCDWSNTEYLLKCAERYGNVSEPSHLHCLAVALSRKLKALPDAEPVAYIQNYKGEFNNLFLAGSMEFADSMTRKSEHYTYLPLYTHPPKTAEREALLSSVNLWLDNLGQPNCGNTMLLTDIRAFLRGE
jgi:hypothetical protein